MANLASSKVESLLTKTVKRRTGRPPGSKTRPDAPSKIARLNRDSSGHFLPKNPPAPPSDSRLTAPAPAQPASTPSPAPPGAKPDTDLFGATPKFEGEAPPDTDAPELHGAPPAICRLPMTCRPPVTRRKSKRRKIKGRCRNFCLCQ